MIAQQVLNPCSKSAATRLWRTTTLAAELKVEDIDADALYDALDWLLSRQPRIEKRLAARHLQEGAKVLFDASSSSYRGRCCILATYGYNRDGIYIVRTSETSTQLSAEDTVRTYKSLGQVEQAFRCIKSIDLQVRPIRHRTEDHVRAHIFLCMLAYYVQYNVTATPAKRRACTPSCPSRSTWIS